MNDLLGGKEAGEGENPVHLPKNRSEEAWARPENFQPDLPEVTACGADKPNERKCRLRSRRAQRMQTMSAPCRLGRSGNVPKLFRRVLPTEAVKCKCGRRNYKTLFTA